MDLVILHKVKIIVLLQVVPLAQSYWTFSLGQLLVATRPTKPFYAITYTFVFQAQVTISAARTLPNHNG